MLHDCFHADHADRVQPEPSEGVFGQPAAGGQHVPGVDGQEHGRVRGRRGGRPTAGGRHDDVADVRAERAAVRAHAARGRVERPDQETRAVHAAPALRRADPERRPAGVRLLLQTAADGGGRYRRDHTDRADRWPIPDDHDRVQLHRRRHFGTNKKIDPNKLVFFSFF